jgi:hypothetical protein
MTTATLATGKRVQLSIEEKARLLQVIEMPNEPGLLAVRSGSDPTVAYAVYCQDFRVTGCRQYGRTHCAYRLAAQHRLNELRRNYHCEIFGLYN